MTIDATSKRPNLPNFGRRRTSSARQPGSMPLAGKAAVAVVGIVFGLPLASVVIGLNANMGHHATATVTAPLDGSVLPIAPAPLSWTYDHGVDDLAPKDMQQLDALTPADDPLPKAVTWVSATSYSKNTVSSHQGESKENASLQLLIRDSHIHGSAKDYSVSMLTGIPVDCDKNHPALVSIDGKRPVLWKCTSTIAVVFADEAQILNSLKHSTWIDIGLPRQHPNQYNHFVFWVKDLKPEGLW